MARIPPDEVKLLQVTTPARDLLFSERVEAGNYRDGTPLPVMGTAHEQSSSWPNHKLCGVTEDGEPGWLRFWYMATRAAQEAYNYALTELLGNEYPEVRQTWVLPRTAIAGWSGHWVPGAAIAQPPSLGGRTWTFQGESQERTDPTTDGLFVVVTHVYWDISTARVNKEIDLETGEIRTVTRQMAAASLATAQGVDVTGQYREVQQINRLWSEMTTRFMAGLAGAASKTRVFASFEPWSWPGVLERINVGGIPAPQASGGGVAKYVWSPVWRRLRYTGPCRVTITEQWTRTVPEIGTYDTLRPAEIRFAGAMLNIDIEPCLHGPVTIQEGTSVATQQFGAYIYSINFPATNFRDWPPTIVGKISVTPAGGGYLTHTMLIDSPTLPGEAVAIELVVIGAVQNQMQLAWTAAISDPQFYLEVSRNPTFAFDFVPGYNPKSLGSATQHTVLGLEVDRVYYARVTHRTGVPAATQISNIVVAAVNGGPVIEVWDEDAELRAVNGTELVLGSAVVGVSKVTDMSVRNTGSYPLVITGVELILDTDNGWVGFAQTLTPQTVAPGAQAAFTITFTPVEFLPGAQYSLLRITSQTPADGVFELPLLGNALEAVLEVQHPYGTTIGDNEHVLLEYLDVKLFRIRNQGDGPLRVTVTLTAGAGLVLNNGAGEGLPSGIIEIPVSGFQNFGVSQSTYGVDGTVTITSNDPYQPVFTITVEGEDAP